MAWKSGANSPLGVAAPNGVADTAAQVAVGTMAKFFDDTLGEGEFIYLPGVANTAIGDLVEYDLSPVGPVTVRHSNATASNSGRPVAIAMSASIAGTFGWYQISGVAIANAVGGTGVGVAMGSATAGSFGAAADAGDQILGARISSAVGTPSAGKVYATISRPFVQGQIT
jgi:hypothetical protein